MTISEEAWREGVTAALEDADANPAPGLPRTLNAACIMARALGYLMAQAAGEMDLSQDADGPANLQRVTNIITPMMERGLQDFGGGLAGDLRGVVQGPADPRH